MNDTTLTVPHVRANWHEIWTFAFTYNAYDHHGGFQPVAQIARTCHRHWAESCALPDDLDTARTALFFEQRRFRHYGWDPTGPDAEYVRALLDHISQLRSSVVRSRP